MHILPTHAATLAVDPVRALPASRPGGAAC
jgi:hypothetical protein